MHAAHADNNSGGPSVLHLLGTLDIGGKERAALRLAMRGNDEGQRHELLLFDAPYRGSDAELSPGETRWTFAERRPGIDLRLVNTIARTIHRCGIDVVHAHNDTAIFYAVLARTLIRDTRVRLIGTFHTRPTHPRRITRLLSRLTTRRADHVTAVSRELARWVQQAGLARHCETIVNGIDLRQFAPQAARSWTGAVRFAAVSRLAPIKRHVDLLDAFETALAIHPQAALHLHGSGPMEDVIRRRAAKHAQRVVLHGTTIDVAAALAQADVFVQCSDHEGTPLALLEAMAAGLPVICTDTGGMPDLVGRPEQPDCCGIIVPVRDTRRLAEAMVSLAEDAPLRAHLGRCARLRAETHSFEHEWQAYQRMYEARPA